MKNLFATLLVLVAAAAASFGVLYVLSDQPEVRRAAREGDAMEWLRVEFHLDGGQFAAIKQLHDDYGAVCAQHCAAIMKARRQRAAAADIAALEAVCANSMTEHFRRVAALMPAGEGERYLAIVLPRVAAYDHSGAPNLQVRP